MDILLTTINAKYAHSSFALRYLRANLGALRERSQIVEFTHQRSPRDVVEAILATEPRVVALSVYIWNVQALTAVARILKAVRPALPIVIGGPEVSYEWEDQALVALADVVVTGEGEAVFEDICTGLLAGQPPAQHLVAGGLPDVTQLILPYDEYNDVDIAQRVIYVEASRGCPFRCEFCLSSLDAAVRNFPLEPLLVSFERLMERGAQQFKFIDRTFNLKIAQSERILRFFLERYRPGLFVHFEMIPDRLPAKLRDVIAQFPAGALQFEVGVQTLDDAVSERISRRQDVAKLADNLQFLNEHTGVHVHADLIVGLPGEDFETFAKGFNRLFSFGAQEIQVGILKRLRGTPIARHTDNHAMRYDAVPPYEVLQTDAVDFNTMQRMKRFALLWDRIVNRGNFVTSAPLLWAATPAFPFEAFMRFTYWMNERLGRVHSVALTRLADGIRSFCVEELGQEPGSVADKIKADLGKTKVAKTGNERQLRRIAAPK